MEQEEIKPVKRKIKWNTNTLMDNIINKPGIDKRINDSLQYMIKQMSTHIEKLAPLLATSGIEKRINFSTADERMFIDSTGISFDNVNEAISKCKMISDNFITQKNPFYILSSCLVFYFNKNKIEYKGINVAKLITFYMAIRLYKTVFGAFFPNYLPNREVMSATIEKLDSNRYSLKKYKTIFATLKYIADSHYENFQDILSNEIDDNVGYYLINLHNRIRMMVRTISNLYYENHKKGVRLGEDSLELENEEGETYLNDIENISTLVTINSRKIYMSFISDSICNTKILRSVCNNTKISMSKMTITINNMISSRDNLIETLITKMLSMFYLSGGTAINSTKFLNIMAEVYRVSNTANQQTTEIKEILDQLMRKFSKSYLETNNISTISVLKKTLFLYIVFYSVEVMK